MSANAYSDGKFDASRNRGYDNDYNYGSANWWAYIQGFIANSGFDMPADASVDRMRGDQVIVRTAHKERMLHDSSLKQ